MSKHIDYIVAFLAAIIFTSWHAILTSLVISSYDEIKLDFSYVFGVEWLAFLPLGVAMLLVMWLGRIRPRLFLELSTEVFIKHFLFAFILFVVHSVWQQYINSIFFSTELNYTSIEWDFMNFLEMRYLSYIIMIGLVGGMIKLKEQGKLSLKESDLKLELQRARLRELELKMNPEIIYPTIEYIKNQTTDHPEQASQMVILLAGLLRKLVDNLEGDLIYVSDDIQMFLLYRDMLQLRKEKSFEFEKEVESFSLSKKTLPMILLIPFLEELFFGRYEPYFKEITSIKYKISGPESSVSYIEVSFYPLMKEESLDEQLKEESFLKKINILLQNGSSNKFEFNAKVEKTRLKLQLSEPKIIDK